MTRLATVLVLTVFSRGLSSQSAHGDTTAMFEFIIDAIRKSDTVVVALTLESEEVAGRQEGYIHAAARVTEAVKGRFSRDATVAIEIAIQGKETARVQPSAEYLLFLRGSGGNSRLLDLTRPVPVGAEERERFVASLRRAERMAATPAAPDVELKRHYFDMLRSRVRFFVTDAAKACSAIPSWSDGDLQQLIAIVNGDGGVARPQGNDHDHLAAVIIHHGSPALATRFARQELREGQGDAVYFGLMKRTDRAVEVILAELLRDEDETVRREALRVAGLLRKNDLLDQFERQAAGQSWVPHALDAARALAARD